MTEVERLNKWLKDSFGTNLAGLPIWKIVWSDAELENRYGTYTDTYHDVIFLKTVTEIRLVPKYNYISERWILERWCPPETAYSKELPDSVQGSYEPVYVFQDKDGNYLPPIAKALEFIMWQFKNPKRDTVTEKISRIKDRELKEVQEIEDTLDTSVIATQLRSKEAVAFTKDVPEFKEKSCGI